MPDEPPDYNISGWRSTGRMRVVAGWFSIQAYELWKHENGAAEWRRYRGPLSMAQLARAYADPASEEHAA